MLVLSRKVGEQVVIGPNIVLTVLEVRGNTVKLGCQAPPSVTIRRQEITRRLHSEEREATMRQNSSPFFAECA